MRPTVKLWEICEIERWGSPRPIQEFLTTDENWINWIKIWDTKTQPKYIEFTQEKIKPEWVKRSRMVYPWDFILSNSMSFGRPYIMKTSWCIHDWRLVLRPDNRIDKEFLYYLLGSNFMYKKFENSASWTWVKNLNIDKVKVVEIPLPPLETQKAIVARLDQIFAELDQTKSEIQKNLDNTDELRKSALNQAFQGDWEMKKLGEVCEIERWGSPRPIQEFLTTAENWVNWIKIWDTKTQPKYIEFTQEKIKPEWVKRSRMVYPWDFILSNSMSFGRPYIMKTSWCIHDWRLVLRPDNTVDKEFLYYLLGSDFMYKKFESTASWTGVKNLNIDKVKVIEISIPPLSEQEKIVEHLDQVSKEVKALKSKYQSQLDNLEELKKSVLDKAFRWEMG